MSTLELHQLDTRHSGLRICDPGRRARLEASLSVEPQHTPIVVVPAGEGRFVVIDGYLRIEALRRLGRDTVDAVVLELGEAEALVLRHRMGAQRRSALEDGWLVATLLELGKSPRDVANELGKSTSWVSRRLALVEVLPEAAVDAVRRGRVGAHAAEKVLVPLARANAAHCTRLVAEMGRPTDRQIEAFWKAYRAAKPEGRERLVANPELAWRVEEATSPPPEERAVTLALEAVSGVCGRARKTVRERHVASPLRDEVRSAWTEAKLAFEGLGRALSEEGVDAGS